MYIYVISIKHVCTCECLLRRIYWLPVKVIGGLELDVYKNQVTVSIKKLKVMIAIDISWLENKIQE